MLGVVVVVANGNEGKICRKSDVCKTCICMGCHVKGVSLRSRPRRRLDLSVEVERSSKDLREF